MSLVLIGFIIDKPPPKTSDWFSVATTDVTEYFARCLCIFLSIIVKFSMSFTIGRISNDDLEAFRLDLFTSHITWSSLVNTGSQTMHKLHSTQLSHGRCTVQYSGKQLQVSWSSFQQQYQRNNNQPLVSSMFRCTCWVNQYFFGVYVSVVTLLFMVRHVFLLQQWLISIMKHIWVARDRDHVTTDKSSASDVVS